jgi:hypothetical protein
MNCNRSLEHWDRGFKYHSMHGCLSAFILCLCCPVQVAALRPADPPSKESWDLKTEVKAFYGCPITQSRGNRKERGGVTVSD